MRLKLKLVTIRFLELNIKPAKLVGRYIHIWSSVTRTRAAMASAPDSLKTENPGSNLG